MTPWASPPERSPISSITTSAIARPAFSISTGPGMPISPIVAASIARISAALTTYFTAPPR
jgi:hypothetical protein